MDANLKNIISKVTAFWNKLSRKTRFLIIAAVAAAVIITVIVELVMSNVSYSLLYSGLSDSDSGQIVTQLKAEGVRYKVDGSSIYVDRSKADETRMTLAENGYPQSDLTYSIFDSSNSWAMTDSDKKQVALYQLQNRLQDTINTIPAVASSVVTITQDNNDTYVLSTDKVPVTASVKLSLRPGSSITNKQVQGIVQLVSHGVSDLSSDNVTVLDSDGNVLNDSSDPTGGTSEQIELQGKVENEIRQKVLAVLNPVYGQGNVQVAAGATLDFSQKTTSSINYSGPSSGGNTGYISTVSSSSSVSGTGTGGTGTGSNVGFNSGQPSYPTSGSSASGSTTSNAQSNGQTSYIYNSISQQIQSEGGELKSLTVAVVLNSKSQNAANVNLDDLKKTIAFSVGLPNTNDVTVQTLPFAAASSSAVQAGQTSSALKLSPMVLAAAGGALILLIAAVVLLTLLSGRRRRKRRLEEEAAQQAAQPAVAQTHAVPGEPVKSIQESIEESSQNTVKRQIENFADQKPELVAQLLRNWLKD